MNKILLFTLIAYVFFVVFSVLYFETWKTPSVKSNNYKPSFNNSRSQVTHSVKPAKVSFHTYKVKIFSSKAYPPSLNLRQSDQVVWESVEKEHEIECTDTGGNRLFSVVLNPGDTFNWQFFSKGTYNCIDKLNQNIKMTINVN